MICNPQWNEIPNTRSHFRYFCGDAAFEKARRDLPELIEDLLTPRPENEIPMLSTFGILSFVVHSPKSGVKLCQIKHTPGSKEAVDCAVLNLTRHLSAEVGQ